MSLLLSLSLLFASGCACDDTDLDGACDDADICEGDDFADSDDDGVCDAVDLCDGDDGSGDADADGVCDDGDTCEGDDSSGDADSDGVCDDVDACEGDDSSGDADSDGICDAVDLCNGDDASGDTDEDGTCNDRDNDDDNDTVPDVKDTAPLDSTQCEDLDADTCDDCSQGLPDPLNDGPDTDADGLCDAGDEDDDNDGALDIDDSAPKDPFVCSDTDADTCEDCSSGVYDPANDGDDWNADGQCDAVDPVPQGFTESQSILGKTLTCDSVTRTSTYSECTNAQVDGLYFPNGIECGPNWSTSNSSYTDHESFCLQITGSTQFEVYYTCSSTTLRITLYDETWGDTMDNGYTESIRCYFPS